MNMFEAAQVAIKNKNGFISNDPDGSCLFYYEERFLNQLGYGYDPCDCDVHVAICECENGRCFTKNDIESNGWVYIPFESFQRRLHIKKEKMKSDGFIERNEEGDKNHYYHLRAEIISNFVNHEPIEGTASYGHYKHTHCLCGVLSYNETENPDIFTCNLCGFMRTEKSKDDVTQEETK